MNNRKVEKQVLAKFKAYEEKKKAENQKIRIGDEAASKINPREMSKDDYVIICGDFGGIWTTPDSDRTEKHWLEWLESKPFTILFVDGNHECFDRLKQFKTINYHGGKAHQIRNNIYHLMRGYVFEFEGKKFFTFGGASSQDIKDGILNIEDYSSAKELVEDYNQRTRKGELLRINHLSWWKEELPTSSEMRRGIRELEKVNYAVDYVITHCLPQSVVSLMFPGKGDKLTEYFNDLLDKGLKFNLMGKKSPASKR